MPLPEEPLSHLTAPEDVDAALVRDRKAVDWCKGNRNGGAVPKGDGSGELRELTAEEVEAIRDEQEVIPEHAPRRGPLLPEGTLPPRPRPSRVIRVWYRKMAQWTNTESAMCRQYN